MTDLSDRFFYHSFTRPIVGRDQTATCLKILECIANRGLILAPEVRELTEPVIGDTPGRKMMLIQKRICFTELAPNELAEHSRTFGPFSVEWDIETLRAMGAIPVFYVPITNRTDTYEGLAAALLARLTEIQALLTRLETLSATASAAHDPLELLRLTVNGVDAGLSRISVGAAQDLSAFLQSGHQSFELLRNAVQGLAGYFYPVDDLQYTGALAYYRQREWRIVGNLAHLNQPVIFPTDAATKQALVEINETFWSRQIQFFTGDFARVDQSQIFPSFLGRPIIDTARRIIGPEACIDQMRAILAAAGRNVPVEALEAL